MASPRKRRRGAFDHLIGAPLYDPEYMELYLSAGAQTLVRRALMRLEGITVVDYHTHLAGRGRGSICCVPPTDDTQFGSFLNQTKMRVFMSAFGVSEEEDDTVAAERLAALSRHVSATIASSSEKACKPTASPIAASPSPPPRLVSVLLAFDGRYDRVSGKLLRSQTPMIVPNDYVYEMAARHPDIFCAACSVNPLRRDALAELERCAARGARICKWLPNSMQCAAGSQSRNLWVIALDSHLPSSSAHSEFPGSRSHCSFSPADEACDPFYGKCVELGMTLLVHVGDETSVDMIGARVDNALGNPLLLRRALQRGVRVIAAHCASEGSALDDAGVRCSCFDLLMGMMGQPQWEALLFADISALTIFKRAAKLRALLERPELLPRCIFGSDYPVPCLGGRIIGTKPQPLAVLHGGALTPQLCSLGLLSRDEAGQLDEVFQYNPLLCDLVLKLSVRHPSSGAMLPASLFGAHLLMPPSASPPLQAPPHARPQAAVPTAPNGGACGHGDAATADTAGDAACAGSDTQGSAAAGSSSSSTRSLGP